MLACEQARFLPEEKHSMNRWLSGGLIVVATFLFMLLLVWAELRIPACRYIIRPGLVITVSWLGIDFWRYPGTAFCLAMAFDALIYGALFWALLELAGFVQSGRKSESKISN
jgi:hypothetical protein